MERRLVLHVASPATTAESCIGHRGCEPRDCGRIDEILGSVRESLAVSNYGIVTVVEFDGALSLPDESTLLTR